MSSEQDSAPAVPQGEAWGYVDHRGCAIKFKGEKHRSELANAIECSGLEYLYTAAPSQEPAVPQGWKLVPVEIDPDMVGAFVDASAIEGPCWAEATDGEKQEVVRMWAPCWAALLAATPAALREKQGDK